MPLRVPALRVLAMDLPAWVPKDRVGWPVVGMRSAQGGVRWCCRALGVERTDVDSPYSISLQNHEVSPDAGYDLDAEAATVFIVDPDEASRAQMRRVLLEEGRACRDYANGQAFLSEVAAGHAGCAGCALVYQDLPDMDAFAVIRGLEEREIHLPVIVVSDRVDAQDVVRAIKLGAFDYIQRPLSLGLLNDLVGRALSLDEGNRRQSARRDQVSQRMSVLTRRELEILRHVLLGKTSKQIGRELGISHRTVEVHRAHALRKLGVRSLLELLRLGIQPQETGGPPSHY